jgi:hypothetical protein
MVKGRCSPVVSARPADRRWEEDSDRPKAACQATAAVLMGPDRTRTAGPPTVPTELGLTRIAGRLAVRMTPRRAAPMRLVQRRTTGHEPPELPAIPKSGLIDWIATKTVS